MNKVLGILLLVLLTGVRVSASTIQDSIAVISVEPRAQHGLAVGDTFVDSIYITDVEGMFAWQARVSYDPEVIRWKRHKEGPFMTSVSSTMFLISLDDTANGKVLVCALFFPPGEPYHTVSGSGTVLYITWQVKSTGSSLICINDEDTYLMDTLGEIPCEKVDGYYNPPWISILSPAESDYLKVGCEYEIGWCGGLSSNVKIELWKAGSLDSTIADSTQNDSSYLWTIPAEQEPGSDYELKIIDVGIPIIYDSVDFNIYREIQVTFPNGGETLYIGEPYDISWVTSGSSGDVELLYSTDGGSNWGTIVDSTSDNGSYRWVTQEPPTTEGRIKVSHLQCPSNSDESDENFTIELVGIEENVKLQSGRPILNIYPNPFTQSTVISYQLPVVSIRDPVSSIQLTIYDLTGRVIKSFGSGDPKLPELNPDKIGMNSITVVWTGTDDSGKLLPSGIYFCKLQVGNRNLTKQLLLLR